MTTIEKGEKGNNAEMTIKAPPHFLVISIYLFKARSEYNFIFGRDESQDPIQYDTIPPIYERIPRIMAKSRGELNLPAHITNISGGSKPRMDSDTKNRIITNPFVSLLTM
jgi:hypothetical protein